MTLRNRWPVLFGAVLAMAAIFAVSCGGDNKKDNGGGGGQTPSASGTSTSGGGKYQFVLTEAPSDAAPPDQQKITVNLRGEPDSIDPQKSSFSDNISVEHLLFAGLLTFDDDVKVVPLIATEVPSVANGGISSDGLTYTFKMRNDVKWTDGQIVKAGDFEYAIKRLFDPTVGVYYASFFTDIVGAQETYEATDATPDQVAQLEAAIGVKALDDTTLEIKLKNPTATFVQRMAMHATFPVRKDIIEAHPDDWTEPGNIVTNGPYKLKEWQHQDHITVEANPDFFLGAPVLKEIKFIEQTDANVAYAAYKAGQLTTSNVPPAARQEVRNTLKDELHEGPTVITFALEFNNTAPPFDDVNVRKAFAAAMDRDAYVTGVLQGVGVPAITWLPPGIPGYDKDAGIPFDKDKAKSYLAASTKYPNGQGMPAIKFTAADDTTNQLIAEFVKAQAKDVLGLDVEIEILESAAFEDAHSNSRFQMAFGGWGADYPDPDNWLPRQFGTGASLNQYNYSNPQVDALFAQAASELDNEKRIGMYQQAQRIIFVDDAALAPLDHSANFILVKPELKGFRFNPLDAQIPGDYGYARYYVSK